MSDQRAKPLMRFCPYCGGAVESSYRFCAHCGTNLVQVTNAISPGETEIVSDPPRESARETRLAGDSTLSSDPVPQTTFANARREDTIGFPSIRKLVRPVSEFLSQIQDWPPNFVPPRSLAVDRTITAFSYRFTFRTALILEVFVVLALTALAAWVRIDGLADPSPGINIDESAYAPEIHRIVVGEWIGKFTGATTGGSPTLQFYITAPLFVLFDSELFAMRIVSAIAGIMVIPVVHIFMRRFFSFTTSLVTTTLVAFSVFFMLESRIGWPLMLAVLELFLGLTLLVYSVERRLPWLALLAGVILGAGMYTHQVFLPYWAASIGITVLLALLHPSLRHRRELYFFAVACFLSGINMAWFLLFDFDFVEDLENHYGVSTSIDFVRYAQRGLEVFMFFRSPISADFTDAAPPVPVFGGIFQVLFLIGIVTSILKVKDYRYQLLFICLVASMVPTVIVPGSEARRFLVGMFFMFAFAGLGFSTILQLLVSNMSDISGSSNAKVVGFLRGSVYVVLISTLVAVSAISGYNRLDEWKSKDARWTFNYDLTQMSEFIKDFDETYTVHLYSDRSHAPHPIIDWVAPHLKVINGAVIQVDGERVLDIPSELNGPILVALLESYINHAPGLRERYPDAGFVEFVDENQRILWSVLAIRDS